MIQHIQVLAEQAGKTWQELNDEPGKVFFPNFGDGDNILKSGVDIDRVMFTIPGTNFKIYWYGFLIALGIILAMIYGFRKMKKAGIDPDRATDAVIGGFFGAIIGARLYYILFSSSLSLKDFFDFRNGGLAIYGGIIGAIAVGGVITRMKKLRLTTMLDVVAPCFFIGQAIGRWGNFFNQEAFGTNTDKPWGMMSFTTANYVNDHITDGSVDPLLPIHPCFLYESLWCLAGFIILHLYFKHRKFDGEVILGYAAWYGLGRFFIEGLRTDSLYIGSVRVSQLLAGVCFVGSVAAIIVVRVIIAKNKDYVFFKDTELSREQILQYENAKRFEKERRELKAKIAEAKTNGEDAAELEKEYEEQFGETGKKKRAQALIDAEQADIKAAAERKAKRAKSQSEDTDESEKPSSEKTDDDNKDDKTEKPLEEVKGIASQKSVESISEVKSEIAEKTEEYKSEPVEVIIDTAEEQKPSDDEAEASAPEKENDDSPAQTESSSEQLKPDGDELAGNTEPKPEDVIERNAVEIKTEAPETKPDNKPKQNNNRNRNNRNKNRSRNNNNRNNNNNRPNNNKKQGGNNNRNKNGQKNNRNNNNKPNGENK